MALNYCPVVGFLRNNDNKIIGVEVRDKLTGQVYPVRAKKVINATGIFSDTIRTQANPLLEEKMVISKGEHISIKMIKNNLENQSVGNFKKFKT